MRVVLLDMDGVLNSAETLQRDRSKIEKSAETAPASPSGKGLTMDFWLSMVDDDMVARLKEIVDACDAKIVMSSSWRLGRAEEWFELLFLRKGVQFQVIGKTPNIPYIAHRTDEIMAWLYNPMTRYGHTVASLDGIVVLDDAKLHQPVKEYAIRTSWKKGLQDEHVEPAKRILRSEFRRADFLRIAAPESDQGQPSNTKQDPEVSR